MAYKLIQAYRIRDPLITETLDNFDFYIMPVVNPDGKQSYNQEQTYREC
jgi:murein tripeptide amidase MpaA